MKKNLNKFFSTDSLRIKMNFFLFLTIFLMTFTFIDAKILANEKYFKEETCAAIADTKKKKALFIFPVDDSKKYTWYMETTPELKLEYAWDISISLKNSKFTFGLYLFKPPNQKAMTGELKDLLSHCQQSVSRVTIENNISNHIVDPSLQIGVILEDYGLGIFINDPKSFDQILGEKPEGAHLQFVHPDQTQGCNAKIHYK